MYKWANKEQTQIEHGDMSIPVDLNNRHYVLFLESGEVPAPWKTDDELKKDKKDKDLKDLDDKLEADIAALIDPKDFFKTISRAIRLLRREMHLVATPEEKAELNILADIDKAIDVLIETHAVDRDKKEKE